MKAIRQTTSFKRDFEKMKRGGKDMDKLKEIVRRIANRVALEDRHRDHALVGTWKGSRDCHIEPDWLLIYRIENDILYLERTGSHSSLFK